MVDDIFPSYNYYADLGRKTSNTFVLSTQPKTSSTATVPNIVCDSCFAQHFLLSTSASLHSLYDVDKGLKSWPTFLAPQSLRLSCINENFFNSPDEFFFLPMWPPGRSIWDEDDILKRLLLEEGMFGLGDWAWFLEIDQSSMSSTYVPYWLK